ncbi:hypothetical protein BCR37DRAFT_334118, partial [Protomyces lactucae-debilis]
VAYLSYTAHHGLPEPEVALYDSDGQPQFSEAKALEYVHSMADDIGYRIVGTQEHVKSRDWLKQEIHRLVGDLRKDPRRDALYEVEVLNQPGRGSHRFDFMGKVVMKQYEDIENVVVRISSKMNGKSKQNSILVNAHLDSTLPSPGAADDGVGIAIQLEILRVMTSRLDVSHLENSVILLFNDAEESLQDASHLFATQPHPWAHTVRGVINLEAAGNRGPSILFQATSPQMLDAYSHVPYPYGTVMASDIFATGLILSDTDFRQFEQYGNMTGLDTAIVANSYAYHTQLDTTANVERGATQQFGENTLAIVTHLTQPGKVLQASEPKVDRIYFSVLQHWFVSYSTKAGNLAARLLFSIVLGYLGYVGAQPKQVARAMAIHFSSLVGALAISVAVSKIMTVAGLHMKWFANDYICLVLYLPAALLGFLVASVAFPTTRVEAHQASLLFFSIMSLLPIGSSFWMFYQTISLLYAAFLPDTLVMWFTGSAQAILFGTEGYWSVLGIFVPLTGRLGGDAPAETIIAIIVAVLTFFGLPLLPAYLASLTRATRQRALGATVMTMLLGALLLSTRTVWDAAHPRRVFSQHMYNLTDGSTSLHFACADSAPGFGAYVSSLASRLQGAGIATGQAVSMPMNEWVAEWDVVYPFSQFLDSYKVPLETPALQALSAGYETPTLEAKHQVRRGGLVDLVLEVKHAGLIWTVMSFDADVVDWSLPRGIQGYGRHHVKHVGTDGISSHTLTMTLNATPGSSLFIDFVGIDVEAMYPHNKHKAG